MKNQNVHVIPLFFKLWFAFIAVMIISIFSISAYIAIKAVNTGPEAIGAMVGKAVAAYQKEAK
jgi:hypothetical protein